MDAPASSVVAGVVLPRLPSTKALYIAISSSAAWSVHVADELGACTAAIGVE